MSRPCVYCGGESCITIATDTRRCCPDCSGPENHVRADVAADIRTMERARFARKLAEVVRAAGTAT